MRSLLALGCALAGAALEAGCSDAEKAPAPPPAASAGSAAPAPRGSPAPAPRERGLALPEASGAPPRRTQAPLRRAGLEALAALEVPGWQRLVRYASDANLEVRYVAAQRPVAVTIHAGACFDCLPLELPRWQARADALKVLLPDELRDREDTVFEVGAASLGGAPLVYTYQLGFGAGERGEPRGAAYSSAYALYHHDGVNQLRVVAQYLGDPVATRDELASLAPREDLARIALAFLEAYARRW